MLFRAIEFATRAHAGQYRKGTRLPYIVHPLAVATILIELDLSEPLVVAGLLHDTVEDTPVTLDEIRQQFGDEVARLVEAASEPDKKAAWELRKRHTVGYLKTAPMDVLLLTCADKLDNVRSIRHDIALHGAAIWSRFSRPVASQHWYYASLAAVFTSRITDERSRTLVGQFAREVDAVFGGEPSPDTPPPARGGGDMPRDDR